MDQIGLITIKEIPAFLKKNNITGDDAKQVTELLTNANKNKLGESDNFVTDFEVRNYIENSESSKLSADLSGKVLTALNEWDSIAAKEFQTKLQTPKEMSVEKFISGALADSLSGAQGTVTLDKDKYQFALYDANMIQNPSKPKLEPRMVLRLTDSQGNSISLDEEHIPEEFITVVKNTKPLNSDTLRTR